MMTEKRFEFGDSVNLVIDNMKNNSYGSYNITYLIKVLNNLHEESQELKQFKEDVFANIDMHLRMLPTARDNEFNEYDGDPSLYTGAIYMLETLKKELKE